MCLQRVGGAGSPTVTNRQMDHWGCCEISKNRESIQRRNTCVKGREYDSILL